MTAATQWFMSYERGTGDIYKVKKIFNMSTLMHLCIALVLVLVFEIAGYFFFNGILNIGHNRLLAAKTIYQFMVVSTFFTIVSVPYEAVITSHENMFFYAIEGIVEALIKLAIAFYITYNSHDRLISYGFLIAGLSIFLMISRRIYCHWKYEECQINIRTFFDIKLLK
jgi:O-antigen/teichoic acid export membrane protein